MGSFVVIRLLTSGLLRILLRVFVWILLLMVMKGVQMQLKLVDRKVIISYVDDGWFII